MISEKMYERLSEMLEKRFYSVDGGADEWAKTAAFVPAGAFPLIKVLTQVHPDSYRPVVMRCPGWIFLPYTEVVVEELTR